MKKIRIVLSVFAFVVAVATAFAFRLDSAVTGYQYQPPVGIIPASCNAVNNVCDDAGTFTCRVTQSSPILGQINNPSASCGLAAKRLDQAPM